VIERYCIDFLSVKLTCVELRWLSHLIVFLANSLLSGPAVVASYGMYLCRSVKKRHSWFHGQVLRKMHKRDLVINTVECLSHGF